MGTKIKTVDNLGTEVAQQYEKRIKNLPEGESFLRQADHIAKQTEQSVVTPAETSEIDTLLGSTRQVSSWAVFLSPPNYDTPPKALFSTEVIPYLRANPETFQEQQKSIKRGSPMEEEQVRKEETSLGNLFHLLKEQNRNIEIVNNFRLELTKG
ncbi:MAG: DUF5399 family protein [Chlamydiota bacterium]